MATKHNTKSRALKAKAVNADGKCELAGLAVEIRAIIREIGRLEDARDEEHRDHHLCVLHEALCANMRAASWRRARSPVGLMLLVTVAADAISEIKENELGPDALDDRAATVQRALHGIMRGLELQAGVGREYFGLDRYLPESLAPQRLVAQAVEGASDGRAAS